MSRKSDCNRVTPAKSNDDSVWVMDGDGMAALVSAGSLKRLEINGAPIVEQSHEYILRKPRTNAPD